MGIMHSYNPLCDCQSCLNSRYGYQAQNGYEFGQMNNAGVSHIPKIKSLEERKVEALEIICAQLERIGNMLATRK